MAKELVESIQTLPQQHIDVNAVRQAHAAELDAIIRYRCVTNYLAAAQIYLKENMLLEEPLQPEHIKDRLLGHWGTSPGINLVYAHLNRLIKHNNLDMFLVTGPGHGAPANLSNLYLEGGQVIEVLSEHDCQAWLQGYLLTGRHGLFPSYEAFLNIIVFMADQFAKFLKISGEFSWRLPVPSLNYLETSTLWRQEHNGFSHQNPGFINAVLNKKASVARVYLPPDANCLVSTMDHCLHSKGYVNLIIANKQRMPQWLAMDEAIAHCMALMNYSYCIPKNR